MAKLILSMISAAAVTGCLHSSESKVVGVTPSISYEVTVGKTIHSSPPHPSRTPILLKRYLNGRLEEVRVAFFGWDLNDDGTFDMLQVLDKSGNVSETYYDFDFDGVADLGRKKTF